MADYSFEEQKKITKEMSDKIYNDSYTTTEEELVKDVNWIQASKDVYKQLEGVEWSGSDEDAAKKGLDMMGRFNYNLTLGTINYTAQLQDAPDQTKLSFYYLMDMYDKKDISGNGVLRAFKEMGLDPASYIGIGTLGIGFAGKQAAAAAAKKGLKEMLKQGAIKFLQNPTAVAATEGAIYTAADDIARQEAAIGAGVQDEYSPDQTAVAAGVGGVVGAGFVQGAKAVGKGINKVIQEGEEAMAQAAGGGTPPKFDDTLQTAKNKPQQYKDQNGIGVQRTDLVDRYEKSPTVTNDTYSPESVKKGIEIIQTKLTDNPVVKIKPDVTSFQGEITLLKNKEKAPNMGSKFGQDVEPSGFYAIQKESIHLDTNPNYETVKADVSNPLIIDVSDDVVQWKRDLSKEYKAKGKALTNKLLKKGYDSIITTDKNGDLGEIIILDTSKIKGAK